MISGLSAQEQIALIDEWQLSLAARRSRPKFLTFLSGGMNEAPLPVKYPARTISCLPIGQSSREHILTGNSVECRLIVDILEPLPYQLSNPILGA
jgi:hypothetical protein